MNTTFVTHPSVRIKGTENNYNPVQCFDPLCANKTPHMHCPFCVNSDSYCDPVILKAHYRVKHVDKGIDFAGLKVLRCCDHCDIVGIIKGEKKFKGAHWHCYKCRNGFNRRDEAVKHYKTHFRNPQTTFQIQIAQEVNQPYYDNNDDQTAATTLKSEEISIHPALTEAVTCMATTEDQTFQQTSHLTLSNGKLEGTVQLPVAANETVGLSDTQTIMIIQEDTGNNLPDRTYAAQVMCSDTDSDENETSMLSAVTPDHAQKLEELTQQVRRLELENSEQQQQITQLKEQVAQQNLQIEAYQRREQELLDQLSVPLDKGIQELLDTLEAQHKDLLHQQLAYLKRSYLQAGAEIPAHQGSGDMPQGSSNQIQAVKIPVSTDTISGADSHASQTALNTNSSAASVPVSDSLGEKERGSGKVETNEDSESCKDSSFSLEMNTEFPAPVIETVTDENLHISSEDIPIENDGCPPAKRRK